MALTLGSTPAAAPNAKAAQVTGMRKNGKQWHEPKKPFRTSTPSTGKSNYAKRVARESQAKEVKAIEKEMKAEKEDERQVGCDTKAKYFAHFAY